MTSRLSDERGFTLIELIVVCLLLGVVMMGIGDLFVSGTRAQSDTQARIDAQQNANLAISRLEYEARCASGGVVLDSGTGVSLTLPSTCSNASGTVSWCVASGVLTRYPTNSCTGTGQPFADSVTSASFSIPTAATGELPQLDVQLTVNETGRGSDGFSASDAITFRNAARTS
jgi:prepilin-type N-terminal cleavage/methylation domain-containing protein